MKATDQYFPVVLFIMLYTMVLTFESVDLNKSYLGVLSYWKLTSSALKILWKYFIVSVYFLNTWKGAMTIK